MKKISPATFGLVRVPKHSKATVFVATEGERVFAMLQVLSDRRGWRFVGKRVDITEGVLRLLDKNIVEGR
jgi:hypothetical protein